MADSRAKYHPIPSLEDQTYHSDVHEAGVGGDNLYSTSEGISVEARTKWTYFLLGCAILLPWNGETSRQTTCVSAHDSTQP